MASNDFNEALDMFESGKNEVVGPKTIFIVKFGSLKRKPLQKIK